MPSPAPLAPSRPVTPPQPGLRPDVPSPAATADYQSEYYGPGGNYDFFPQGPPSSQVRRRWTCPSCRRPGLPGHPLGGLEHPLPGHHPSSEAQRFTDILAHPPGDSPSPEPSLPGPLHSMSAEARAQPTLLVAVGQRRGELWEPPVSPPEMNERPW